MPMSNPSDVLKVNKMMRMDSLPFPLNLVTMGHTSECQFTESIRVLCSSCELNYRRTLSHDTAKNNNAPADLSDPNNPIIPPPGFINCGVQPATPVLPCNCGWPTKAGKSGIFHKALMLLDTAGKEVSRLIRLGYN